MNCSMFFRVMLTFFVVGGFMAEASRAQEPLENLGAFRDWTAYRNDNNGALTCFAVSKPTVSLPTNVNRDPTYFFITTRPQDGTVEETSIDIGYPFKKDSKVKVTVGNKTYMFHTENTSAWLTDITEEPALVNAIKKGSTMIVEGISHRGTNTKDTYSLLGVTSALKAAKTQCK